MLPVEPFMPAWFLVSPAVTLLFWVKLAVDRSFFFKLRKLWHCPSSTTYSGFITADFRMDSIVYSLTKSINSFPFSLFSIVKWMESLRPYESKAPAEVPQHLPKKLKNSSRTFSVIWYLLQLLNIFCLIS